MQTFVPYGSDFVATARVLDRQRLGKQRVEAWQIVKAHTGEQKGWRYHPATKMWDGYVPALCWYGIAMCDEWIARGYTDTLRDRFVLQFLSEPSDDIPAWLDRDDVITSHRSNLIRKRPDIYGPIWPDLPDDLPYVWPTTHIMEEA
jgi:hypothetical protein